MDFLTRQKKLKKRLADGPFDALLINHLPNIRYLSGFTGSAGILFVGLEESVFFTDVRYDTQSRDEVKNCRTIIAKQSVLQALTEWLSARKRSKGFTIGVEADHITMAEKKALARMLPGSLKLKAAPAIVERLRMIKDAHELKMIRSAVRLGASLFDTALEALRDGKKENEVAAEMEYAARMAGAEAMSFPTIIAAGKRSALPHGRATRQNPPRGSFVVCDFGVILNGYCSDQSRTVWMGTESGSVPSAARKAYEVVKEAQQAALTSVRPGISAGDVDEAARSVLRKAKLASYFTHSTGHGVGLEIHETPRVAAGQKEVLRPGMVITVEPGIYFPGKWGIRIEDMVAVTESGGEVLTPGGKDFTAVKVSKS